MKSSSQVDAQVADWLARRDGGSWTDEQQCELARWLDESTAHRVAYLRLQNAWRRADRLVSLRVPRRLSVARSISTLPRFSMSRIAAGLLIVVAVGAMLHTMGVLRDSNTFSTALGESRVISLADGTRVTLNTSTRLRVDIGAHQRTIWLDRGEAYFDVLHDPHRPFIVNAGGSRIADIGTKFSVRRSQDVVHVVVLEGQVQVGEATPTSRVAPVLASRNDTVAVAGARIALTTKSAEQVADMLDWREGKLVLDQMTLEQAAREFNRYNRKQLMIDSPTAASTRIGGRFNVNNIEGFARLLHEGFGLRVVEDGDVIHVIE